MAAKTGSSSAAHSTDFAEAFDAVRASLSDSPDRGLFADRNQRQTRPATDPPQSFETFVTTSITSQQFDPLVQGTPPLSGIDRYFAHQGPSLPASYDGADVLAFLRGGLSMTELVDDDSVFGYVPRPPPPTFGDPRSDTPWVQDINGLISHSDGEEVVRFLRSLRYTDAVYGQIEEILSDHQPEVGTSGARIIESLISEFESGGGETALSRLRLIKQHFM
ncbi:hypothetical protein BJ742DRAFT_809328 [Cladochytrium replicatum]|nr:hypothetical protein BJ742DRAFT_809328 [Cladochytrium replicatum]